jgi:hypothetical protein
MLTASILDTYVGHSISEICPHGYDSGGFNHCAHFVSHAMQIDTATPARRREVVRAVPICASKNCSPGARTRAKFSNALPLGKA